MAYDSVKQRIDAEIAAMEVGDLVHTMIKEYVKGEYGDEPYMQSWAYFRAHERLNEMFKLPETCPHTSLPCLDGCTKEPCLGFNTPINEWPR